MITYLTEFDNKIWRDFISSERCYHNGRKMICLHIVITPTENPVVLEIPKELLGHKVKVTVDDLESNGHSRFASIQEALSNFNAIEIDTRGFSFDREDANAR